MEVSDKLIAVATMLFILSMISERIVTFIKLWCVKGRSFLFIIVSEEVDTSVKSEDPDQEARRARSILAINLTVSFLIALLSKASLFDMFSFSNTEPEIWDHLFSWQYEKFTFSFEFAARLLSIIFGCALTGSFISLGSKFWHDLLDLLLQVKNLKSKLNDRQTYEIQNIKGLEQYINTDYNELARTCLEQNKSEIDKLPNVENYFIGLSSDPSNRKPVIILHSSLQEGGKYPTSYKATLSSGKTFKVRVEVVYGFSMPKIHLSAGDSICNTKTKQVSGTICCSVQKEGKKYLLTCAHVLTGGLSNVDVPADNGWFLTTIKNNAKSKDLGYKIVGTWCYGIIKSEIDAALIETKFDVPPVSNGYAIQPYRYNLNHEEVFVNGNKNQKIGYVMGYVEKEIDFDYNGSTIKHTKLIMLAQDKSSSPITLTEPGDSGALVYLTKDKMPLGMVLGGNTQYTYVMPLEAILTATQTKLI